MTTLQGKYVYQPTVEEYEPCLNQEMKDVSCLTEIDFLGRKTQVMARPENKASSSTQKSVALWAMWTEWEQGERPRDFNAVVHHRLPGEEAWTRTLGADQSPDTEAKSRGTAWLCGPLFARSLIQIQTHSCLNVQVLAIISKSRR